MALDYRGRHGENERAHTIVLTLDLGSFRSKKLTVEKETKRRKNSRDAKSRPFLARSLEKQDK